MEGHLKFTTVSCRSERGWLNQGSFPRSGYVCQVFWKDEDMPTLRKKWMLSLYARVTKYWEGYRRGDDGQAICHWIEYRRHAELICDGESGLFFWQDDYMELSDKMEYLIRDPEEIMRMGLNAQKYASGYFSIERCAAEIEEVYRTAKLFIEGGENKGVAIAWNVYDDSCAHLVYGGAAT